MQKAIFLFLFVLTLFTPFSCTPKAGRVERIMEDGVEVVLNHFEPYKIKGEPTTFALEREFSIDTENEKIAELGLTEIGVHFDVDSEGNIFLNSYKNPESMIFRFDRNGNFVHSFAHKGQGPGELQGRNYSSLCLTATGDGNIVVSDFGNKLAMFGREGNLIKENRIDSETMRTVPLANGNFLSFVRVMDPSSEFINQNPLTLLNSRLEEIKVLDKQIIPNPIIGKRLKGTYHTLSWSVSKRRIFTGFQERGYEIFVYDFDGNFVRKIRKEHKSIPVPEKHKKKFMEQFRAPIFNDIRNKIYFPDAMPPFHGLFTDDEGRLYVMTYESGENPGEFMYDIFNPDGVCTGRKSLKIYHDESGLYAKMKNGRFFCLNEKASGYKELVVSRVIWE
jgi:hypothetical protein